MNQIEPLPTIWDKLLDQATLDQYFKDLATHAEMISVQEKLSPTEYVSENTMDWSEAREKVMSGDARAVQIRYHYDEQEWCDTLMRQVSGVKLIRIAQ